MRLLSFISLFADLYSIVSVWAISDQSPLWNKLLVTALCIFIAVVVVIYMRRSRGGVVVDSEYDERRNEIVLFIKRNGQFANDTLVSIFHEERKTKPVAIGYIIDVPYENETLQISIYGIVDAEKVDVFKKKPQKADYKKFVARPLICHSQLQRCRELKKVQEEKEK